MFIKDKLPIKMLKIVPRTWGIGPIPGCLLLYLLCLKLRFPLLHLQKIFVHINQSFRFSVSICCVCVCCHFLKASSCCGESPSSSTGQVLDTGNWRRPVDELRNGAPFKILQNYFALWRAGNGSEAPMTN